MAKKIIALILIMSTATIIGCSKSDNVATTRAIATRDISNNHQEVNQKKALRLYNKYLPKLKTIFEEHSLNAKNLNENIDDTEFVSRLVYNKTEGNIDNTIDNNIETIWYGLMYDDNNTIESLSCYVEYNINNIKEDGNGIVIRDTVVYDIGKIFFRNTTFNNDIVSAIDDCITTETVEQLMFEYKKGTVELSIRQDRLIFNINLNVS